MTIWKGDIPPVPKLDKFGDDTSRWALELARWLEDYVGGISERTYYIETGEGVVDHDNLNNLAFAAAGHTGFQAQDAVLDDLSALPVVAVNEFIVGDGAGSYAHFEMIGQGLTLSAGSFYWAWLNIESLDDPPGTGTHTIMEWDGPSAGMVWTTTPEFTKVTINQASDAYGFEVYGFDDQSAAYGKFGVNSSGTFTAISSANMLCTASGGVYFRGTAVFFQDTAAGDVSIFGLSGSGTTREVKIFGYRAADALRSLQIGIGVDAANTVSFDGLANYRFDGNLQIGGTYIGLVTDVDLLTLANGVLEINGELDITGAVTFDHVDSCTGFIDVANDGGISEPGDDTKVVAEQAIVDYVATKIALGSNLIINGTFDADSDWSKAVGWTISAGEAHYNGTPASGYFRIYTDAAITSLLAGKTYLLTFVVSDFTVSAGDARVLDVFLGSGDEQRLNISTITANGTYKLYFTDVELQPLTEKKISFRLAAAGAGITVTCDLDDVVLKQIKFYEAV